MASTKTAPASSYWLAVNSKGVAKIVESASNPTGYSSTAIVGSTADTIATIEQNIANAVVNMGASITNPVGSSLTIPGKGSAKITGSGFGNAIGTAASAVSSAVTSVGSIADLFTSGNTWKGIGLCVAGGVLVLLGLMQLTGVKAPAVVPV